MHIYIGVNTASLGVIGNLVSIFKCQKKKKINRHLSNVEQRIFYVVGHYFFVNTNICTFLSYECYYFSFERKTNSSLRDANY